MKLFPYAWLIFSIATPVTAPVWAQNDIARDNAQAAEIGRTEAADKDAQLKKQQRETSEAAKAKIAELDAQIAQTPNKANLYLQRAQEWEKVLKKGVFYDEVGQWDKARADYAKALELEPKMGEARARLAQSQVAETLKKIGIMRADKTKIYQEPPVAVQISAEFERAIADTPNFASAYDWATQWEILRLARTVELKNQPFFLKFEETDMAVVQAALKRTLDLALSGKTRFPQLQFNEFLLAPATGTVIDYLRGQKQSSQAIPFAEAKAALFDKMSTSFKQLAQLRLETGDFNAAMSEINRAIALEEKDVAAKAAKPAEDTTFDPFYTPDAYKKLLASMYSLRAQIRLTAKEQPQDENALLDLQKGLELVPSDAARFNVTRAQIFLKNRNAAKAFAELNAAAQSNPNYGPTFQLRARMFRAMNKIAEAEADEKRVTEIAASEKEAARIRAENPF